MSLKLIREAQIITSSSKHELAVLETLKQVTGKSLIELTESYSWTPEDYAQMLELIKAYGMEQGMNVNKRGDFAEIAFAALENDSKAPMDPKMQEAIVKKLWLDFKAQKHQAKLDKLAQAHEEEEQLAANLRSLSDVDNPGHSFNGEDEEYDMDSDERNRSRFSTRYDPEDTTATEHGDPYAVYRARGGRLSRRDFEEDMSNLAPWEKHAYIHGEEGEASEDEEYNFDNLYKLYRGNGGHLGRNEFEDEFHRVAGISPQRKQEYLDHIHGKSTEDEEYGGIRAPNYQDKNQWNAGQQEEWYDEKGRPDPNGAFDAGGHFHADRNAEKVDQNRNREALEYGHLAGRVNRRSGAGDTMTYGMGSENEEQNARYQDVRKLNPILDRDKYKKNDAETIQGRQRLGSQENEEKGVMTAETGETIEPKEKNAGKSAEDIAHSILTAPRELMKNAVKNVKDEGAKAWKEHGIPKNPHPIKSAAHRHWLEGMRKAAMADLGLEPKPAETKPKRR